MIKNITSSMPDKFKWCSYSFFALRWCKNRSRKKITPTVKKNTNLEKFWFKEKNKNIGLFLYNLGRALCFYFLNLGSNFENLCFFLQKVLFFRGSKLSWFLAKMSKLWEKFWLLSLLNIIHDLAIAYTNEKYWQGCTVIYDIEEN